ncbi:MAG: T9SS type A sorting domain-containing protein [Chitinophagales bacterium]|nr:T9SS type A sorting domain-containing protein [Chitinophagales bacterium]
MFSNNSFNCAKNDPDRLFLGGIDTYRSSNAGATWELVNNWYEYYDNNEIYLHADIPFIETFIDPATDEEVLLISTDGGLYTSEDYANHVTNITLEGMRNAQYYDVYTYREDPVVIYAGAQDQGYQRTASWEDEKYFFDQLISGDYGHFASTDKGENVWMLYPGFITYIKDAPGSSLMTFGDFEGSGYLWLPPLMNDPVDKEVCWWGGGKYLYKVEKVIGTLDYTSQGFDFSNGDPYAAVSAIAYSEVDSTYWYVLNSTGVFFYSTDGGDSWEKTASFDGPDSHYFYGSTIVPSRTELGTVYIAGSGYSNPPVYKSTDNGETFTAMSTGLPSTLVYDMAALPNDSLIFAATEVGPYIYVKDENKWYDLAADAAPFQVYWSVDYVDEIHTARFGTYGRGIFDFKMYYEEPPVNITEIIFNNQLMIYPNPATSNMHITLNTFLPVATIKVYDLHGNVLIQKNNVAFNKNISHNLFIGALDPGNYFIEIEDGQGNNNRLIEKFIVAN